MSPSTSCLVFLITDPAGLKHELNKELNQIKGDTDRYDKLRKNGYEEDFFLKSLRDEAAELRSRYKRATDEKKQLMEEVKNAERQKELTLYASKGVEAQVQQMADTYTSLLQDSGKDGNDSKNDYRGWGAEQVTALKQLEKARAKLKAVACSAYSIQQDRQNPISGIDTSQQKKRNKCRSLWFFMDGQCRQSIISLANQLNQMSVDYWFLTFQDTEDKPILSLDQVASRMDPQSKFKHSLQHKTETDMSLLRYAFRVVRCNLIEFTSRCKSTMTAISDDITALVDDTSEELQLDETSTS